MVWPPHVFHIMKLGFGKLLLILVMKSQSSNYARSNPSPSCDFGAKLSFVEFGIARVELGLGTELEVGIGDSGIGEWVWGTFEGGGVLQW